MINRGLRFDWLTFAVQVLMVSIWLFVGLMVMENVVPGRPIVKTVMIVGRGYVPEHEDERLIETVRAVTIGGQENTIKVLIPVNVHVPATYRLWVQRLGETGGDPYQVEVGREIYLNARPGMLASGPGEKGVITGIVWDWRLRTVTSVRNVE